MHYGDPIIRKTVPLALGLVSASNPVLPILDTLFKYSHDNDLAVALNAIFAMGLVGAGMNNAHLAQMLRQLAGYYYKEPDCLFMVCIAQAHHSVDYTRTIPDTQLDNWPNHTSQRSPAGIIL